MQSCLYRAIPCPDRLGQLPPRTRVYNCLEIDAPYPAATLAELLGATDALPLGPETRCLALDTRPDPETAMRLAAHGVDAAVTATTILLLEGLDDAAYRSLRDRLAPTELPSTEPRRLPDDAFVGFTRTPLEQVCAEAERLGLALPPACLEAIIAHYTVLARDPWPDELLVLDEAFRAAMRNPAVAAPVEFVTDDDRLHSAFADAMAKRRALSPDATAPATLGELSGLATRYLCAHRGVEPPPVHIVDRPTDAGFASLDGKTAVWWQDNSAPQSTVLCDDRLVLVTRGTAASLEATLDDALAQPQLRGQVRRRDAVEAGRLIPALGRLLGETGLGLLLARPDEGQTLLDRLIPREDCVLMTCAPSAGRCVPQVLREAGLHFFLLGHLKQRRYLWLDCAPDRFCLPVAMLAPRPALAAECPRVLVRPVPPMPTGVAVVARLGLVGRRLGCHPATATVLAQMPASVVRAGEVCLCALSGKPSHDPYAAVRDAAFGLLGQMVAAGVAPETVTFALHATVPTTTPREVGRGMALLLGLHAVQVELGLLAEPARLNDGETLSFTLTAYAPAKSASLPRLCADLPLWLIAPRSTAPHFDGERALLALAATELRAGHPVFATAEMTAAAAATRAVLDAGLSLTLTAPDEVANEIIPCGMLVAAPEMPRLPDGVAAIELGRTLPGDCTVVITGDSLTRAEALAALRNDFAAPVLRTPTSPHPPRISSHRVPRPRVVILRRADEAMPTALIGAVASLGGEPVATALDLSSATSARQSLSTFADTLDGAQILLLGDDRIALEAIFAQRRALDALTRLRERDGLVCAWGEAFACLLARGCFSPDGAPIATMSLRGARMLTSTLVSTASPWVDDLPLGYTETAATLADPRVPKIDPETRAAMADAGLILACATGTPDGAVAVTAMTTPDGGLLGLPTPPSMAHLRGAIAYFA